jgi:hypothetical protein
LQAVTVSDLTINTGLQLDLSKRAGHISLFSSVTPGIHVNQDRPSVIESKLWKKENALWSEAQ